PPDDNSCGARAIRADSRIRISRSQSAKRRFPMLGLMQSQPLLISALITHAERHHGDGEIVSRRVEGDIHRYTWRDVARRAKQVAHALDSMSLLFSDRVATLAWNGYR